LVPSGEPTVLSSAERQSRAEEPRVGHDAAFLEPRPGGPAERLALRCEDLPAAVPIAGTYVAGWAALSAVFTAIGLVLIHLVLAGQRNDWDESINRWLVDQRTPWVDRVTSVATFMANTVPVLVVLGVSCLVLVAVRRWREALFLLSALTFELTVFLTANALADRGRPNVPRLDSTPSTGSFPSGHVAASLALWVGLALIVGASVRNRLVRAAMWIIAVVVTVVVGFSRAYRGMHHVTDVVAGAALGIAALIASALTVRVVSAVASLRSREPITVQTEVVV
jgi:undecaprenyl-diphosphatase